MMQGESSALVIGGGVAGMQASLDLARSGIHTILVEREAELGGRAYKLSRTYMTHECKADGCCMDYCRECVLTPKFGELQTSENLEILYETEVDKISGKPGKFQVELNTKGNKKKIGVNAIVVTTGSTTFDADKLTEFGHDRYEDVMTFLELEKMIVAQREAGNILKRPSDGKVPEVMNFLLCAGSRDANKGNQHCSIVCCTYAIGQAKDLKVKYPDMQVYVHYMDLRAAYRGFEEFYKDAQEKGVRFLRGRVSSVEKKNGDLMVRTENIDSDELLEIRSDLVVLVVGQEPHEGEDRIAKMLGLGLQPNGFIKENKNPGVEVAGCALGPRGIRYSVEDAKRAASKIIDFIKGGSGS